MKGAMADPLVNTIKAPNASKVTTIGTSQYFFRVPKNPKMSLRNSM
jgi:hypothetical protein